MTAITKTLLNALDKMTVAELRALNSIVVDTIKAKDAVRRTVATRSFSVGDKVTFTSTKHGNVTGVVNKVNKVNVIVKVDYTRWTVPATMLSHA